MTQYIFITDADKLKDCKQFYRRIRRMAKGTVFSLSVHTSTGEGGVPGLVWMVGEGGYPSQVWMVGGGTPAKSGWWRGGTLARS